MNVPRGDAKSVFSTSSGVTCICSYASVISMTETYLCEATTSQMRSWFGSGVVLITVFAFRSLTSTTVRSFNSAPALGIHNSRIVFLLCDNVHHPVFM